MKTMKVIAGIFATAALFSGPGVAQTTRYDAPPVYVQSNPANFGVIEAIERTGGGTSDSGKKVAGTILGGIVGGVIGHQFGSGRGNDAATVAGALGGAAVGHGIAENRGGAEGYRVSVRLDSGDNRTFWRDNTGDLAVGDRVQIDNDRLLRMAADAPRYEQRRYGDDRRYNDDRRYSAGPETFSYDARGSRIAAEAGTRHMPARADNRVYHYDSQGYRVDQHGNRYDEEGYWVDERGFRHEYQDPPLD